MTKFPKSEKIKEQLKKLKSIEGTALLPSNASPSDKFKFELCKKLLIFMREEKLTQRQLAEYLEVNESRISEIVHYKIDKLTVDRLLSYNEKIHPKVSFKVAINQ